MKNKALRIVFKFGIYTAICHLKRCVRLHFILYDMCLLSITDFYLVVQCLLHIELYICLPLF